MMQPLDLDQIKKGMEVEMEHTNDRRMALKIALDHLKEDPKYYDKLMVAGLEEDATDAPSPSNSQNKEEDGEVKTSSDLRKKLYNLSKELGSKTGLDTKEIKTVNGILDTIFSKIGKGSLGPTLDAIGKILNQKTKSVPVSEEENSLKTYGDLKKIIKSISLKQKGQAIVSQGKSFFLDQALGLIPGASNAKTTYDFIKAAISKPDDKKTKTWLDRLDVDDQMSKIVDDTVENGFMKDMAAAIDQEANEKELEPDFNMNAKMVNWLSQKYGGRHVAGIKEEELHEGEFCPQCLAEYIEQHWNSLTEAEYKGRKVPLGKPMKGDKKKFKVYVKNQKGNVVKVEFGQPGVQIKKHIPARRKSFRARHRCENPGPRWKARYWSCRKW